MVCVGEAMAFVKNKCYIIIKAICLNMPLVSFLMNRQLDVNCRGALMINSDHNCYSFI